MSRHPVPDAALEADIATIAQKGAGKTFANRGLVERLLDMRRRVVIIDPLNSWWGLKARADGKPGYPIAVVGGPNADVDLDPTKGEQLAAFVAGSTTSVVLDVSEMRRGEMIRFVNDFLATLYRANRNPLWLVLEEADVFAPQQPMGDATMLLHNVDQIARRGRARGFRLWSITQRPAKLHKDVLTQTSTLIMLRIRSPQDRAAAEAWIAGNADSALAKEIVASLASLPVGEGYVWAPDHGLLERVKFPPIKTLDTSATPEAGAGRPQVGRLAVADLDGLRQALEHDFLTPAPPTPAGVALADGYSLGQALKEAEERGFNLGLAEGSQRAEEEMGRWVAGLHRVIDELAAGVPSSFPAAEAPAPASPPPAQGKPGRRSRPARSAPPTGGSGGREDGVLSAGARKLLLGVRQGAKSWPDAAVLAVMAPHGGAFNGARKQLLERSEVITTDTGLMPADDEHEPWPLPENVVEAWANKLGGSAARILRHLYVVGPQEKEPIAEALEIKPHGGSWNGAWKALRVNGLVEASQGRWGLTYWLRKKPA